MWLSECIQVASVFQFLGGALCMKADLVLYPDLYNLFCILVVPTSKYCEVSLIADLAFSFYRLPFICFLLIHFGVSKFSSVICVYDLRLNYYAVGW